MSDKILMLVPEVSGTEDGSVISFYPEDTLPFGMNFLKDIQASATGTATNTTRTASVTVGLDTDTDPEDSDFD
jgi:hypothetical protein